MKYKFQIFNTSIPDDVTQYEALMSELMDQNSGKLLDAKETNFTKSGDYLIAIHYTDDSETSIEKSNSERSFIEDNI